MAVTQDLRNYLRTDATLVALLTGGIWSQSDVGRMGLDRTTRPEAFDAVTRRLKPAALLHARGQARWGRVHDPTGATVSARQVVEIYLYDDGDRGYNTIETARRRIRQLLDFTRLPGYVMIKWINNLDDEKAEELNNANMVRADYEIILIKNV